MQTQHANPQQQRRKMPYVMALTVALGLSLVVGCRDSGPGSATFTSNGDPPLRIAVIPFTSPEQKADAGPVVTSTVITYLLSTGKVEVIEPGMVD